ncbi:MAG: right-handed parallel beta-helix repeat-containing protein [Coriobacteriales bacterium]|jgi:hypothetical protein
MRRPVRPFLVSAIVILAFACLTGCSSASLLVGDVGDWHVAAFGTQSPKDVVAIVDGSGIKRGDVLGGQPAVNVGSLDGISSVTFEAGQSGEISNNDDGYLMLCTQIDPLEENFEVSATFRVLAVGERAGTQTGFGICATDLVGIDPSGENTSSYRYYNSISCMTIGAQGGLACMRGVSGYVEPDASDPEVMRRCNLIEPFETGSPLVEGASYRFELEKTDEGFTGRFGDDELALEDEGFVAVQDDNRVCVGFFAARNVTIEVTDLRFETSAAGSGARVRTRRDLDMPKVDYEEFDPVDERSIEDVIASSAMAAGGGEIVRAAPGGTPGGSGTVLDPLDLETAVARAEAGQTIVLARGTYHLDERLRLDASGGRDAPIGFVAEDGWTAKIEGGGIEVAGDWWHLRGIEVADAESVGVLVSGSNNAIERCTMHGCGDSGLQITHDLENNEVRYRESRGDWPAHNLVVDCDSYDNCDASRQDADGFAAKLACGEGNVFYGCVAHHNVDDGWDLFAKAAFGPIGPVRIENCVSYSNGRTTADEETGSYVQGDGNGFKLGGRDMPADHLLVNSVAAGNLNCGITSNGALNCRVVRCTAYDNGQNCRMVARGGEVSLALDGVVLIPGTATEKDDQLQDATMMGDCMVVDASSVASFDRDALARTCLASPDIDSIARDPDTGALSLNGSFEALAPIGAHF